MADVKVLNWLTQTRQQAVRSITDLHGLTACSQLVTLANGERFVLRTQNQRATDYGVNYQQEAYLLRYLFPLGFTPKPIYTDETTCLLAWIDGDVPTAFSPDLLRKLAETMARLHATSLQGVRSLPKSAKFDLTERCQFLWDKLSPEKQHALPFSPPFQPITPFRQALCHHDVHLGNLVEKRDRLFLIDWEYAAISDPALDLALFLHANSLSEDEQAVFLRHYFAKNEADQTTCIDKITEYQPEVEKLSLLWYAI